MQTIYRPGTWYLIVVPGALVALPPDVPGDVIDRLWEQLPAEKTLATVVDVLTTQAGGSFASLPPFAAAVAEGDDVRIALRGGVVARVSTASGESHDLSGADVTTWSERFVGRAARIEITVEETASRAALPAQSGIVCAAAVSAELEPGDAAALAAALGPRPQIDATSSGVSAAVLGGGTVPALVQFGSPVPAVAVAAPTLDVAAAPVIPAAAPLIGSVPVVAPVPSVAAETPAPVDEPVPPVASAPIVEPEPEPDPEPKSDPEPVFEPEPEPEPESDPEPVSEPDPVPESDPHAETDAVAVIESLLSAAEVTLAPPADEDFDQLWGATVHSVPAAPGAPAAPVAAGDHDGATISAAELRALRQQAPVADDAPTAVLPVSDAPSAGRIRVSTGQVVALDRTVIIGRRPRSTRASGANLPHLVAVESPQQDISRSHLEVRPEGDTVVVIDLHTTNGSTLLRPGADPMRLHPGEQTLVLSGDVVDLGDGVTVAFEDLP
jgi:outer membrane biosynthesis protein TonB